LDQTPSFQKRQVNHGGLIHKCLAALIYSEKCSSKSVLCQEIFRRDKLFFYITLLQVGLVQAVESYRL